MNDSRSQLGSGNAYERLINVALEIFAQRDVSRLCETILIEAQKVTNADGGTLYLIDRQQDNEELEFAIVRNDSLGMELGGSSSNPVDIAPLKLFDTKTGEANHHNVATHAALSGRLINIEDAYNTDAFDFSGTREFDEKANYRSKSILAVPLLNDAGQVVGVLQLINAKNEKGESVPFEEDIEPVIHTLSKFAATALDQQMLVQEQKDLLIELSSEPNTARLLERILEESQAITHADGGTLYLMNEKDGKAETLEFALIRNKSLNLNQGGTSGNDITLKPLKMFGDDEQPNHHNVACYCAHTKQVINIEDAYEDKNFDFSGTKAFDDEAGYRSKSFLTVPLLNHNDDVIGVLQLLNAQHLQSRETIAFSASIQPIISALASYAAIALNNQILLQDHKNLLDAFIKCIAQAIDAKSPHTSAHCQRVPLLTELIAEAACEDDGLFADFNLDDDEWYELRVASWMHDCGKLSTPDSVLDKSTKLHKLMDGIGEVNGRFEILKQNTRVRFLEEIAAGADKDSVLKVMDEEIARLEDDRQFINKCNKGGEFMARELQDRVKHIANITWTDWDGEERPMLSEDEVYNLCIERGTLNNEDRQIINNHMNVTIDMLESLPFPKKLRRVPEYAGGHHEKMDGTGFPKGLTREEMSIPARMMAIADIFEALTSKDRPYKDPMPISVALNILKNMRNDDHIDPDLFKLFVEKRVWEKYAQMELDEAQMDVEDVSQYLQ